MAPLSNDQLADWRVTLRAVDVAGLPRTHDVKAVYRTRDDILEGWTLLKGVAHKIVFMVRDDVVASIERTSEPAAAVVLPGIGGIAGASSSPPVSCAATSCGASLSRPNRHRSPAVTASNAASASPVTDPAAAIGRPCGSTSGRERRAAEPDHEGRCANHDQRCPRGTSAIRACVFARFTDCRATSDEQSQRLSTEHDTGRP